MKDFTKKLKEFDKMYVGHIKKTYAFMNDIH